MIESPAAIVKSGSHTSSLRSKILNQHLERLAIVYVRQSSTKQVEENIESTQMQYGLVDRAEALGWPRQRIDVIDDDLGVSGRTTASPQAEIAEVSAPPASELQIPILDFKNLLAGTR